MDKFKIVLVGIMATILLVSMVGITMTMQETTPVLQDTEGINNEDTMHYTFGSQLIEADPVEIIIDDYAIPNGGSSTGTLRITNVTDCIIVVLNVSWNPSIIRFVDIDNSTNSFDYMFSTEDTDDNSIRITVYDFGKGIDGDLEICTLEFESAPGANSGDSTPLTIDRTAVWDESYHLVDHIVDDGIATITGDPPCEGTIDGYVYHDLNENGIKDAGEPGLSGWTVQLDTTATLTDSIGYYQFTDLCSDTYHIEETVKPGWEATTETEINQICENDEITINFGNIPTDPGLIVNKQVSPQCTQLFYDEIEIDYGEVVTYKIDVTINTADDLFNLTVKDNLPSLHGFDYITSWVTIDGLFLSPEDYVNTTIHNHMVWYFSYEDVSLLPGTQLSITYCVDAVGCGIYENTVNVSGQISPCCPEGWVYANDSAIVDIKCPSGVRLNKTVSLDGVNWIEDEVEASIGDVLWFKLYIKNLAFFDEAHNLVITDILPDHLVLEEVIEANGAANHTTDNQHLEWFIAVLDGLETHEIIYTVRVTGIGSDHNIACVEVDCEDNDTWCDWIYVNVTEGVQLDKKVAIDDDGPWVEQATMQAGDVAWWNITIDYLTFESEAPLLFNITLKDVLPEGLSYKENTGKILKSDGWTLMLDPVIDGQNLTWDLSSYNDCSLSNNSWLSVLFATDIAEDINGTLVNWVNMTAKQCTDTIIFKRDCASIVIEEIVNHKPTYENPLPIGDAINVSIDATLSIDVNDSDDDYLKVIFYDASDDSVIKTVSNANPPKTVTASWDDLDYNTSYTWYVTVNDSIAVVQSPEYSFTTEQEPDNQPPQIIGSPTPSNGANNIGLNPWLAIHVSDPNPEDTITITFYKSDGSVIGTDSCSSDCTATVQWSNLDFDSSYSWYVTVSDGLEQVRGPATGYWQFNTETPDIELVVRLTGGFGLSMEIENTGSDSASDVAWTLEVEKQGIFGSDYTPEGDVIPLIGAGVVSTKSFSYFGIGRVEITATAACDYAVAPDVTVNGFILGPFVLLR